MKTINIEDFATEAKLLHDKLLLNIEQGLTEVAEDVAKVSQQLAPLDEGGLMESATVEPAVNSGGEIKAVVGYKKEYTLVRHDGFYKLGPISQGKPSVEGMQVGRKFLAQPLRVKRASYIAHLHKKMSETK